MIGKCRESDHWDEKCTGEYNYYRLGGNINQSSSCAQENNVGFKINCSFSESTADVSSCRGKKHVRLWTKTMCYSFKDNP